MFLWREVTPDNVYWGQACVTGMLAKWRVSAPGKSCCAKNDVRKMMHNAREEPNEVAQDTGPHSPLERLHFWQPSRKQFDSIWQKSWKYFYGFCLGIQGTCFQKQWDADSGLWLRVFMSGLQVQGQPGLQSKFKDSQGCTKKPCLKKTKNNQAKRVHFSSYLQCQSTTNNLGSK